ncbi:MAG: diguanylate cyclase [Candidatus Methylomirabilales bacterium]
MAGEKILVMDTEHPARRGLLELLEQGGFQAAEASDGEEALKRLQEGDYAVVLVNPKVPGGLTVEEMVDRMIQLKPEQSIIVTASPGSEEAAVAMGRGAYSAVRKPIQPAELEIAVRNAVERYHLLQANARLREENLQDDLTGVLNRRGMDQYLDDEIERSRRYKHPFSVLFFDLDQLKAVNDQFGHLSGSKVLVEVVSVIKTKLRRIDKIFRFGGDEFTVALPETDQKGAIGTGHRLRVAIRSHRFRPAEGAEVSLTASFGVATFPEDGANGEALLRHADEAMYLIKTGPRDGVGVKERP